MNQKPNPITLKEWLYNLIPFRPITVLIKQVYPDDQIVSRKIGVEAKLFPVPVSIIETNNNFFIDRRLADFINSILFGLIIYFLGPVLISKFFGAKNPSSVQFMINLIVIVMIPMALFQLIWQVKNIEVIKKSWLTSHILSNHLLFLYGRSKIAKLSLSTDKFVSEEGQISLPFKKNFFVF